MSGWWVRVQGYPHICNPPSVEALTHMAGDEWACDECGAVWEWLGPQRKDGMGMPMPGRHGWRKTGRHLVNR